VNDDSSSDAYGDTCSSWYDSNESAGSYGCTGGYDTDDFTASEQCCACQDGRSFSNDDNGDYESEHAQEKLAEAKAAYIVAYEIAEERHYSYSISAADRDDCGGTGPDIDCLGECFGDAAEDCAGECNCVGEVDCAGVCGGDSAVDECGACDGDGIGGVDGLTAQGGINEVFLGWGANDCAAGYNVYDGGELVGSSPVNGFVHDDNGSGFGLGWYEDHCYTVTAVAADGTEGAASSEACTTTLPFVTAGLGLDTSMADQGLVHVTMANFLPVGGYQFNVSVDGADLVAVSRPLPSTTATRSAPSTLTLN
jgi:hypothetical protein